MLALRKATLSKTQMANSIIKKKRDKLGIDGRTNLKKVMNNKFLQAKMNAQALKQRIRARLCERKFELSRLERAYRHTKSNEAKLHDHVSSQVKRHEPGILQLCKKYNALCDEMRARIENNEAPRGAIIPSYIQKEGLFKLDVDDDVWQDIGLNNDYDSENGDQGPPGWLADDAIRAGIKAMLELDRCEEEELRLKRERCAMQEWMIEEWNAIQCALDLADNNDDVYQLHTCQNELAALCAMWQDHAMNLPCAYAMDSNWGPSKEKIEEAAKLLESESWEYESDDDLEPEELVQGAVEDLWDALEISAYTDAYRDSQRLNDLYLEVEEYDIDSGSHDLEFIVGTNQSRSNSPNKRGRWIEDEPGMSSRGHYTNYVSRGSISPYKRGREEDEEE